jgi:hypothetical protein
MLAPAATTLQSVGMTPFFTGAAVNADLLATKLQQHGIETRLQFAYAEPRAHENEFSRETVVLVPKSDYTRAWQLYYGEQADEPAPGTPADPQRPGTQGDRPRIPPDCQ